MVGKHIEQIILIRKLMQGSCTNLELGTKTGLARNSLQPELVQLFNTSNDITTYGVCGLLRRSEKRHFEWTHQSPLKKYI